jgi:hypothetical protein
MVQIEKNIDLEVFRDLTVLRHPEYEIMGLGILSVCLCRSVYIRMCASVAPERLDGLYFYSAFKNLCVICRYSLDMNILVPAGDA